MTTTRRYVGGTGYTDAHPKPLAVQSFQAFVLNWLSAPITCSLTREQYFALTAAQQKVVKSTGYFCSCTLGGDGSRKLVNLLANHLLVLDVDDADAAAHLLASPLDDLLPWNHAMWRTLTSTPEAPRLRLVVDTEPLTKEQYRQGVRWLAARLGVTGYDPVSLDPVHLWYRPTVFSDEQGVTPLVAYRVSGHAALPSEWADYDPDAAQPVDDAADVAELGHLPATDVSLADAEGMLRHIDPDSDYRPWVRVLCALKHQFGSEAFPLFDEWSSRGTKYGGREATLRKWNAFQANPAGRQPVTIRTLIEMARTAGWNSSAASAERIERLIAEAAHVRTLIGPVMQELHTASLLGELEREALLGRIQARSKELGAPVTLRSLKKAMAAMDDEPEGDASTVPNEMQGYVFVRELNLWVHPTKGTQLATASFDTGFAHLLPPDTGAPSRHALSNLGLPVVDRMLYEPKRPDDLIFVTEADVSVLNTYRRSYPEADPTRAVEAGAILEKHLQTLLRDPQRREMLLSWMTWVLLHPGEKVRWHIFLQGAQGCGKSLVCEAFRVCVGPTNARKVSPAMLMEKFNLWASDILFAYFEEVLVGERQKDTMETIKDLVTGATVNIRAMRMDAVERPNMLNGIFLSNHLHGLRLSRDDRRFFCLCCEQQRKDQSELIPREHFRQVFRLQTDLAGGLRHWLLNRPISPQFDPMGHAPETADRDLVLRAGSSELDAAVQAALEDRDLWQCEADVVSTMELLAAVQRELRGATMKGVTRVLAELGYEKCGQRMCQDEVRRTLWFQPKLLTPGLTPLETFNAKIILQNS